MAPKIPPADPLTGSETAIVIQGGKPVRTTTQSIANKAPVTTPPVTSVAGKTGDVTLSKADVGLNNVNNTADANKPISSATQTALDAKADKSQIVAPAVTSVNAKTGAVTLAKADVGLGNVDNTADASKPVSTAQQAALDRKAQIYGSTGAILSVGRVLATNRALTAAGTLTVFLTEDGTANGAAIFPNAVLDVQATVSDASTMYSYAWSVSADRKTLTLTVNRSATPLLSLLGLNILAAPSAAPVGTLVRVLVTGN